MESGALQRDTVLIVDDVEINRAILSAIFGQEDRILEAENGQQALEAVIREADRIKAILLDVISIPGKDGQAGLSGTDSGFYRDSGRFGGKHTEKL